MSCVALRSVCLTLPLIALLSLGLDSCKSPTSDGGTAESETESLPYGGVNLGVPGRGVGRLLPFEAFQYPYFTDYAGLPICDGANKVTPTIDWRTKGVVNPVRNEGDCTADWAFAATEAVEGLAAISRGNLPSLSEQVLLDCDKTAGSCSGGNAASAMAYIQRKGLPRTVDYPYTARVGTCRNVQPVATVKSFCRTAPGNEQALFAALLKGPVAVVVQDNWATNYTHGVITAAQCKTERGVAPHFQSALLVGTGGGGSEPMYWLLKNFVGSSWGDRGYFRIAVGGNVCGITDFALQPTKLSP